MSTGGARLSRSLMCGEEEKMVEDYQREILPRFRS